MRKLIVGLAITLDGFIEGPNGEYDWCFTDQDYGMTEFLKGIDAIFYGRKSWEMMKTYSPPEGTENPWKHIKNYVFSNSYKTNGEDFELITGDVVEAVKKLKSEPGKNIWMFGGASLNDSLMKAGLIDEIGLAVHPILLGKGKPFFSDYGKRIKLKLSDCKTYSSGLVYLTYQVEHSS
ncbi:MAG TPA: dihydrofolate reductase family protein [Chryseosolibacter sp.]